MIYIKFFTADRKIDLKRKTAFKKLIDLIYRDEKPETNKIHYIFCSDDFLLEINKKFLNHFFLTDVITFPLFEKGKKTPSEIYLSTDRIQENTKKYNSTYQNELIRVMIHGFLHICGYNDDKHSLKKIMREKEDFYLNVFNNT